MIQISNIISYLKKPYPYFYSFKEITIISIIIFFISLSFIYAFEPFNINFAELRMSYFWVSVIHSSIPMAVIFTTSLILLAFDLEDKWTVAHEAVLISFILIVIGVFQFLIRDTIYNNPDNWSLKYLYTEIKNTFLVGFLFLWILIPIIHSKFHRKNTDFNQQDIPKPSPKNLDQCSVNIKTPIQSESFIFNPTNFLYARSYNNYLEIHYLIENNKMKQLIRISLKDFADQIKQFKNVIKTHRSCIINLLHLSNINGNANGLKVKLNHCTETLPVSRAHIQPFKQSLKSDLIACSL